MRRAAKAAGVAGVAAGMTMSLATPASAGTALVVGGILQPTLSDFLLAPTLDFRYTGIDPATGTEWVRRSVFWPAGAAPALGTVTLGQSVLVGQANLLDQIARTSGPVTVVGLSAGSLVVDEVLRYYDENPELAPSADRVTFVVIADGTRQDAFREGSLLNFVSGYTYRRPAETKYAVTVVAREYDGLADFPDRPWNLMAVSNALAGILVLHNGTYLTDLDSVPSSGITVTENSDGGVTTRYLVPTAELPMVTLMPFLKPFEPLLKALIDTGYSRNDALATPLATPLAAPPATAAAARTLAAAPASTADAEPDAAPVAADPSLDEGSPDAGAPSSETVTDGAPSPETVTDGGPGPDAPTGVDVASPPAADADATETDVDSGVVADTDGSGGGSPGADGEQDDPAEGADSEGPAAEGAATGGAITADKKSGAEAAAAEEASAGKAPGENAPAKDAPGKDAPAKDAGTTAATGDAAAAP